MRQIDISKPILVTGANGYVASWLVKRLLTEGHYVHAAVRNPDDQKKIGHLIQLANQLPGKIRFFQADLLEHNAYAQAMEGCGLVFHTASPFITQVDNAEKQLIQPAVEGTENVLHTATYTPSVKRVVVTSSCAAMYTDCIDTLNAPGGHLTEDVWNQTASVEYQPYSLSKTLAEKKAWELAAMQDQWDLIAINMSLVLGPALNARAITSESYTILKQFGNGDFRYGIPDIGIGLVDVRDVADAHYLAAINPEAKGRYITSAYNTSFLELAKSLIPKYGADYFIPKKRFPKWILSLFGRMINKNLNKRFVKNNVNIAWRADNSKIKRDLGIAFRPMQDTMNDSFQVLIDNGLV